MLLAAILGTSLSIAQTSASPAPLPQGCAAAPAPVVGTVCTPKDPGRHPAMILLGGSEGGDSMRRSAPLFAAHGYVAMSVAYFDAPGVPAVLVDIPVETIGRAIAALQARADVDPLRIGVFGGSKGGELALLAASTYPAIKAVVADVPAPFAYMGLGNNGDPTGCSWSRSGKPLPCIPPYPAASTAVGMDFVQHKPISLRPFYDASRNADPAVTAAALFPLAKIDGPVLCLAGADDQLWNSQAHCDIAMQTLKAHGHPFPDREIVFPNAGHSFLYATKGPKSAVIAIPIAGTTLNFGGTPDGDAAAAEQAWPQIWTFMAAALHPA